MVTTSPDLGMLLALASHRLNIEMTARLGELGITPRAHCVLSKARGADMTQGEIAKLADLDKTTMVATIDALEAAGLAERRPSSTDRRARIIAVTPAGEQVVARAQEIVEGVYADVLGAMPARDRTAFVGALEGLVSGCSATAGECEHAPRRRAERSTA
jgi:MarR family transcriptional regulator for hemolysin